MNVERSQQRLQRIFHLLCLLLLGLTVYVRLLPSTPEPIPPPDSWEARWWGVWPITYLPATLYWPVVVFILGAIIVAQWHGWSRLPNGKMLVHSGVNTTPEIRPLSLMPIFSRLSSISLRKNMHQNLWWKLWPDFCRDLLDDTKSRANPLHKRYYPWLVVCAGALLITFFLFPIVHTRWGDAYVLSQSIAWPNLDLRLTHSWQAPLDVRLHSIAWHLLGPQRSWTDATPVYRLLSPVAGACYLIVTLAIARRDAWAPPWLSFGLLASLGLLQLFYGYIENYSFAAAGLLLYLYLGLESLHGRRPLWWAALSLGITNALHPSTIVVAPSLLLCAWFSSGRCRNKFLRALVIDVAVPVTLMAVATILMMEAGGHGLGALFTSDRPGGGDARLFVPVFSATTRWEHYTLFSGQHLRDMMNLQLLVAPVILPGLGIAGLYWLNNRQRRLAASAGTARYHATESTWFLLVATLAYLSFVWTWNPDYGGQRDWDLFSLSAIPSTLLLIDLLPRIIPAQTKLVLAIGPLLLLQIMHTTAWIYQNTLPWAWP